MHMVQYFTYFCSVRNCDQLTVKKVNNSKAVTQCDRLLNLSQASVFAIYIASVTAMSFLFSWFFFELLGAGFQ